MPSPKDLPLVGRYVDELAGAGTQHAAIAAAINAATPGAKVAGTLVGRWRRGEVAVSPGNLAALARAYGRSPLEAFVVAGLLDEDDAAAGLDESARDLLRRLRDPGQPVSLIDRREGKNAADAESASDHEVEEIAAHDSAGTIADEQEAPDTP